jgi:hypothetical protein
MPPLEAKKALFRLCMQEVEPGDEERKLMLIDVRKAHLNGKVDAEESVYVELPPESHRPGKCARLKRWLYGMRPAANAWERDFREKLESIGFVCGVAAPTVFHNYATDVSCVVHGDDFTFLGRDGDLRKIEKTMRSWWDLKLRGILGSGDSDDKELTLLNRTLRWHGDSLEYEADPRHAREIIEQLGLQEGSNGIEAPSKKVTAAELREAVELDPSSATRYRALAAKANYLAMDRADVQYATKEVSRDMSAPSSVSWSRLKQLARYLVRYPRTSWHFRRTPRAQLDSIDVFSDSDWAACVASRKSTSGGIVSWGGTAVKTWSSTQQTVSRSSGEAELYALVKAASEGLGMVALLSELGRKVQLRVHCDSSAAIGIANRSGLGKCRHLDVQLLWIQGAIRGGGVRLFKCPGLLNPADLLTKVMGRADIAPKLELVGGFYLGDLEYSQVVGGCWNVAPTIGIAVHRALAAKYSTADGSTSYAPTRQVGLVGGAMLRARRVRADSVLRGALA